MRFASGGESVFHHFKRIFACAADGANPIFGDVFKSGAGSDAAIGIAYFGVINPLAGNANIFFHDALSFCERPSRRLSEGSGLSGE